MSNKKASKRKQNRLKVVELRNQSLKNNAPVFGKKTTLQESNRGVIDSILAKISK